MHDVSLIIPVYNEAGAIQKTLDDIRDILKGSSLSVQIVVVNDASKDETASILSSQEGITVLTHETNKGYGAALKTGMRNTSSEYIMIIDADGTYPIGKIPDLLRLAPQYDMVVGARTGKVVKIPLLRRPAKWFLKLFAQYLTKTEIPDLNSGLRIFRRSVAERFMSLFPDGFSLTSTITVACMTNDYTVKYIPIDYYDRKGSSKIRPIKDFVGFSGLLFRLMIYFRPLNVFMPIALLIFLAGVARLVRDFILLQSFGVGGAMLVLAALQIGFLGIIAELIIKRTNK